MWMTSAVPTTSKPGHWLACTSTNDPTWTWKLFLYQHILKVFIYFCEFKHMPVISETNCKELEGNMGEWLCVQLPRVLQKQDKKIRMISYSRSKSGNNSEVTSQRDKQETKWSGESSD